MRRHLSILLLIITLASSCSNYNRVMKGNDLDAKFDMALRLYNKGNYFKALPVLEELIAVYRGTKKAEKTYYYYAYTNYKIGDYSSAAYDFENFVKTFPSSEFAEECAYMQAYCFFQDSPIYSLDQSNTYKAIVQLQLFIDRYPLSERVQQCNKLIDQLENKLETKAYENARMYYNMDDYKSAIAAFRNLLTDYPSSPHREEVMFMLIKAQFNLAQNSIEEKRFARMNEALTFYGEFSSNFPSSDFKKEADGLASVIRVNIEKLKPNN